MFIRNCWYVAAWDSELVGGRLVARTLLGTRVVVFRGESGAVVVLDDKCCHRLAPLSLGQVEGDCVRCMYHGLVFNGAGQCVEVPGQARVSQALKVRSYPATLRHHLVWVWMGDPALADDTEIHDAHWHDDGNWQGQRGGYLHYKANAQLIADNLLDFSHLAFVHQKSIGTRNQQETRPVVKPLDHGVHVSFVTLNGPTPNFARVLTRLPDRTDRYQIYTWHIKGGFFAQHSAITPVGDGKDSADPRTLRLFSMNVITPETETSSHYFWSISHDEFDAKESGATALLALQVGAAFQEDREMIEAQQAVIEESGDTRMLGIPADATLLQVRQMQERLLAGEAGAHRDVPIAVVTGP